MGSTPNVRDLTHSEPGITLATFRTLLRSKNSPAYPEAEAVYALLVNGEVDPSFALAQFRIESQYGTSGYAKETGSWGNMLYDPNLTKLSGTPISKTTSDGGRYTYATYDSYEKAIIDYIRYLDWYESEYGLRDIYGATARWIGRAQGSTGHLSYVTAVINDMIDYEFPEGTFYETGDKMIVNVNDNFDKATGRVMTKYPIKPGTVLYRGTDGVVFKTYDGLAGNAWFIGDANGSTDWGSVFIKTLANPKGQWVYIKNIDPTKIVKVA